MTKHVIQVHSSSEHQAVNLRTTPAVTDTMLQFHNFCHLCCCNFCKKSCGTKNKDFASRWRPKSPRRIDQMLAVRTPHCVRCMFYWSLRMTLAARAKRGSSMHTWSAFAFRLSCDCCPPGTAGEGTASHTHARICWTFGVRFYSKLGSSHASPQKENNRGVTDKAALSHTDPEHRVCFALQQGGRSRPTNRASLAAGFSSQAFFLHFITIGLKNNRPVARGLGEAATRRGDHSRGRGRRQTCSACLPW